MGIILTDSSGNRLEKAVSKRLHDILKKAQSAKTIQNAILWSVKSHFQSIYPGSSHYNPDKVTPNETRDGVNPMASINIDVPGVTRAYHSITIRPKVRKYLSIPIMKSLQDKKPSDYNDLFFIKTKNDGLFLVRQQGSTLALMFHLVKSAFQSQDRRLMPSDDILAKNVFSRVLAHLGSQK